MSEIADRLLKTRRRWRRRRRRRRRRRLEKVGILPRCGAVPGTDGRTFLVFLFFSAFGEFDPIFTAKSRSLYLAIRTRCSQAATNPKKSRDAKRKEEIRDEGRKEGRKEGRREERGANCGLGKVRTQEDGWVDGRTHRKRCARRPTAEGERAGVIMNRCDERA